MTRSLTVADCLEACPNVKLCTSALQYVDLAASQGDDSGFVRELRATLVEWLRACEEAPQRAQAAVEADTSRVGPMTMGDTLGSPIEPAKLERGLRAAFTARTASKIERLVHRHGAADLAAACQGRQVASAGELNIRQSIASNELAAARAELAQVRLNDDETDDEVADALVAAELAAAKGGVL